MTCCPKHAACSVCRPDIFVKGRPPIKDHVQMNSEIADTLEQELIAAKHAYYCTGETIMTDKRYDMLENHLRKLRPDSKVLIAVGCMLCFEEGIS